MSTTKLPDLQYIDKMELSPTDLKAGGIMYAPDWEGGCHLVLLTPGVKAHYQGWWRVGWFQARDIAGERVTVMGTKQWWNCFDNRKGRQVPQWELVRES